MITKAEPIGEPVFECLPITSDVLDEWVDNVLQTLRASGHEDIEIDWCYEGERAVIRAVGKIHCARSTMLELSYTLDAFYKKILLPDYETIEEKVPNE